MCVKGEKCVLLRNFFFQMATSIFHCATNTSTIYRMNFTHTMKKYMNINIHQRRREKRREHVESSISMFAGGRAPLSDVLCSSSLYI